MLSDYANKFAQHIDLPLLRISPTLHQYARGGKFVYLPDMGDFLSYIKNSTYFITDSFHGTAFALNFNCQFIEILPNNKTGVRNQSILQLTGLQDRIISNYNDFFDNLKVNVDVKLNIFEKGNSLQVIANEKNK